MKSKTSREISSEWRVKSCIENFNYSCYAQYWDIDHKKIGLYFFF